MDRLPEDELELKRTVAEVEARLFGGTPEPLRIARFILNERLGQGGIGVVWSAHDPGLDREIAVKLLRPDAGGAGPEQQERMLREARAMARLAHPNVVAVYEVGEHEGRPFIAMERVRGWTLREWIELKQPTWTAAVEMIAQAAMGLEAAHREGIVHRDFKPENILVGEDGRARVADFGLARAAVERAVAERDGGQTGVAGTLLYMAPEQHRGEAPTPAADQYALCVVLYETLYGSRPFVAESVEALIAAKSAGALLEPTIDTHVPTRIWTALRRGLDPDPHRRFPTIRALLEAIAGAPSAWRRRAAVAVIALAVLLALGAAVLQTMMFSEWMSAARRDGEVRR